MLDHSNHSLLLIDHSKFDTTHLEIICALSRLANIVTDLKPGSELSVALREANVKVHVAP